MSPHDRFVLTPPHCTGLFLLEKLLNAVRKLPVIGSLKRLLKIIAWLLGAAGTLVACGFLLFSFLVLPRLDHYRVDLEHRLAQAVGRPVSIGQLSGAWDGLAPRFDIRRLSISNPSGPALTLDQIAVKPSWISLLVFEPRLALIEISGPSIDLKRARDGRFSLNGFVFPAGQGDGSAGNWLLRQGLIRVTNARIAWQDDYFGLPRVTLDHGQFELANGVLGHTVKLSGRPPLSIGDSAELNAHWRGDDVRHWDQWSGKISAALHGARVDAWRRYLQPFGLLRTGEGDGSMELSFDDGQVSSLVADVKVKNAAYTMPGSGEMKVPVLGGHLAVQRDADGYQIEASHLTLYSQSGPVFDNTSISGHWSGGDHGGGMVRVDNVNLAYLTPFLHAVGVDRNPLFQRFAPAGQLKNLLVSWKGRIESPRQYQVQSGFSQLAWKPFGPIPGVSGVTGRVQLDQNGGRLTLDDARGLVMPAVFAKPLAFTSLNAEIDWRTSARGVAINLNKIRFGNPDLNGWVSGSYRHEHPGSGVIDLKAGVDKVNATRVVNYLPYQAGNDTIHWLAQALRAGSLQDVKLVLSGDLDQFPFRKGQGGLFSVEGQVKGGQLRFDPAWPLLDNIEASLKFRNERMDISSSHVSTLGMPISQVKVSIPDLAANKPQLLIDGKAGGNLQNMLQYTRKSPVDGWLGGLTGSARASGDARLDLGLMIPLSGPDPVQVKGNVHFNGNRVELTSLPLTPLEGVNGDLGFSERGVSTPGVRFKAWGGAFTLRASTEANAAARILFNVEGQADSSRVLATYVPVLGPYLSGSSHYQAHFSIKNGLEQLQVKSDLQGTSLNAPAPLAKASTALLPLNLTLTPVGAAASGQRIDFTLGSQASGRVLLKKHGELQAAEVAIGRSLGALPVDGLLLKLALPSVDLRAWSAWAKSSVSPSASRPSVPLHVELATPDLNWGSYHLSNASLWLGHVPADTGWHLMVDAAELKGEIDYFAEGNGMVRARLPLLVLNLPTYSSLNGAELAKMQVQSLPAMDIRVGNLVYRGSSLGSLVIGARYVNQDWFLDSVRLKMQEGLLTGSLRSIGASSVESRFNVDTTDAGKMLERFGIKDTFRQGQGQLSGDLSWPGTLIDFDLAKVSGKMAINLNHGQFAKVNPGVARLLGVISLQSLTRRIKLDFTDVFSEGFAFDSLTGDAQALQGVFTSNNISMKGPAADVQISGEVNLGAETQQLKVHVEPHMAEGVALATGAALINPVIGVAALAAQKVLQDPVSKIFSVDYRVTGTLTDPVVSKGKPTVIKTLRKIRP